MFTRGTITSRVKLKTIVQPGSIPTVYFGDEYEGSHARFDMIKRTADVGLQI